MLLLVLFIVLIAGENGSEAAQFVHLLAGAIDFPFPRRVF